MTAAGKHHGSRPTASTSRYLFPVFAVSCGLLGFEISLMRILLYASWHHFAFLLISIVLLGFGASGTILSFFRPWFLHRVDTALTVLILATAISMPVSIQILRYIPVEARFVPALVFEQSLYWVLYWAVLFVPFLLGATAIGLALIAAGRRVPTVYAANLLGSALGALAAPVVMVHVAPVWLATVMGGVTLVGFFGLPNTLRPYRLAASAIAIAAIFMWLDAAPPAIRIDPFKYHGYVVDVAAGDSTVSRIATAYGPRAVVDVYEGDVFHELAFLAVGAAPPPMLAVLMDGHWAGSILRVSNEAEAGVVENTLMSVPYGFALREPNVLLLGEIGGANIWLAARHNSNTVDVVQPNGKLIDLLRGPLIEKSAGVADIGRVEMIVNEPRHFVNHTTNRYDLIHLAGLESWAVETGSVAGLRQNNLITIEGLTACYGRLSPGGILSVCRAVQTPPRDNLKLLATFIEALRRAGVADPANHVVVIRDFLAVCTMIKSTPWSASEIEGVREMCRRRELTPVYFAGVRDDELNTPDKLPGPANAPGDWLHHGAVALLSPPCGPRDTITAWTPPRGPGDTITTPASHGGAGNARDFMEKWPFDIRPPVDDRPFFDNFCKLESIGVLKNAFGDLWLTRTELSLLFVLVAAGIIALAGIVLTVVPLFWVRGIRTSPGRTATSIYFVSIGLGYMMLEISVLSRLTMLVGDPVLAGSITIATFLFFSGLGSLNAQRIIRPRLFGPDGKMRSSTGINETRLALIILFFSGIVVLWLLKMTVLWAGGLPRFLGIAAAMVVIAPLGFLMGFPMPMGLHQLGRKTPALVPLAWGINGFASVLAPVLAMAVGMTLGFRSAGAIAFICYLLAALTTGRFGPRFKPGAEDPNS